MVIDYTTKHRSKKWPHISKCPYCGRNGRWRDGVMVHKTESTLFGLNTKVLDSCPKWEAIK